MRFKIVTALAASAAFVPFMAQADGLSYSYVEAGYVNTDVDGFNKEVDGFMLRGSAEIVDRLFVFASYSDQSTSIFGSDLDLQMFDIGLGYAWPLAERTDVYGKVGYTKAEADYPGLRLDDDGYLLSVGLRSRVIDQLELEGSVNYVDLSDSGDDTSFGAAARWYFTERFAFGVEGDFGDDATVWGLGVRWNFGN